MKAPDTPKAVGGLGRHPDPTVAGGPLRVYCVESKPIRLTILQRAWFRIRKGRWPMKDATFRFWTADQAKAQHVASQAPDRRILIVPEKKVPAQVLTNLKRAAGQAA